MTADLNLEARVSVDAGGATAALKATSAETRQLGDAMRQAAADAKASGQSISAAVNDIARQHEAAARARVVATGRATRDLSGLEQQAARDRMGMVRRAADDEIAQARRAANAVIAEAQRKVSAGRQAAGGLSVLGTAGRDAAAGLSLLGGSAGQAAAMLGSGGIVAAVGMAAVAIAGLAAEAGNGAGVADQLADRYGAAGERISTAFIDPVLEATISVRSLLNEALGGLADGAIAALDMAAQAVLSFRDKVDAAGGEGTAGKWLRRLMLAPFGAPMVVAGELLARRGTRDLGRERANRRQDAALAASDANYFYEDGTGFRFNPFDASAVRDFGRQVKRERQEAEREAKRLADTAAREAGRAADAATREARRAAEAQARLIEGLVTAASKAAAFNIFRPGMVADHFRAAEAARGNDDLSAAVGRAENSIDAQRLAAELEKGGRLLGDAATARILEQAGALGQAFGGAAARAIAMAEGIASGDFRGVGGRLGGVLQYGADTLGQTRWFKQAVADPITGALARIFGERDFAKLLGNTLATAGFGANMGALVGGGSQGGMIGGAIGGVLGEVAGKAAGKAIGGALGGAMGPIGSILGSIAGGLLGGLFSKAKTGSATVSITGGQASVSGQSGNNDSLRRATASSANAVIGSLADIAAALGGDLGDARVSISARKDKYYVDYAGMGRTKARGGQVVETKSADEAMALAMANAIHDGAITNVSPRVQQALQRYADNLNRAVAEAVKVQDLEKLLANARNPFAGVFQDFERQMKERLRVARDYGFEINEIERLNGEERARLIAEQTEKATASVKALLDDLKFGNRAEGSAAERLQSLGAERRRLQGLVDGGDIGQSDALAAIIQRELDLRRQAYGTTGEYAAPRAEAVTALEALLAQAQAKVQQASDAARDLTNDRLAELNGTADEQMTELQRQSALLAQISAALGSGGGLVDPGVLGVYARVLV